MTEVLRGLPVRALAGTAIALLFFDWSPGPSSLQVFNTTYLAIVGSAGLAITATLAAFSRALSAGRVIAQDGTLGLSMGTPGMLSVASGSSGTPERHGVAAGEGALVPLGAAKGGPDQA